MKLLKFAFAALAALAFPAAGQSPAQLQPTHTNVAVLPLQATGAAGLPGKVPAQAEAHDLTQTDVDAWLDGFMPYAMKAGGVPGAVVVVVKDGRPLTMRGFGYSDLKTAKPVDPSMTLFRPGSVSKLFTWTAVMQLVQAGKVDLDKDVNIYLDFKVPPRDGKPITLRNLMTHTAGFQETAKYLIKYDTKPDPLGKVLSRWVPERIYAPGTMPAYSNYGASLAGYIVERVSREPFDSYIQRHIFGPLGMSHSTFEQPLPVNLRPFVSQSYEYPSVQPKPYEVIPLAPAGALAASGADMGKFMIAHLANGGALLNPATAQLMHGRQWNPYSSLPGMALGFYHEDRNGLNIVGHGGDTIFMHSDLHLFLDQNVGLFVSMNSAGKNAAVHPLREQLFEDFTDRYFPAPAHQLHTTTTAKAHGELLSGHYVSSRAGGNNFTRMLALFGETSVSVDKDGILTASSVTDPSGNPRRWREVGSWLWQEVNGTDRLQALVDRDNHVKMFSITPYAPIIEFLPAPNSLNAGWILPAGGAALLVLLVAALGWPVVALTRRRFRHRSDLSVRRIQLHRATRTTAWLYLVVVIGWVLILVAVNNDLTVLNGGLDMWMRLLQLVLIVAFVGTALAVWNAFAVATAPGKHWFATISTIAIALAAVLTGWLCLNLGLFTASLNY